MNRHVSVNTVAMGLLLGLFAGCRPSEILTVPPPVGIIADAPATQTGAESVFAGEKIALFQALSGGYEMLQWAAVLSDEFTWSYFKYGSSYANIDARQTVAKGGYYESADYPLASVLGARSALLIDVNGLAAYPTDAAKAGEAFALAGYAELLIAEDYCAGLPLDRVVPAGGIQYGGALTTDSLLGAAEAHFDSAIAHASGSDTVLSLASVGLARALIDRGRIDSVAAVTSNVPTSFVYNIEMAPVGSDNGCCNFYSYQLAAAQYAECGLMNVADREGGNGLDFVSARDPRLVFDSTSTMTCDGKFGGITPSAWYYPTKFGMPTSTYIPLATGIEARLIEAEAALRTGTAATWLADLNTLRTSGSMVPAPGDTLYTAGTGGVSGLPPLADPGTDSAEVRLMFRERAFWLFGTGTRLGDMRRLIRQYGTTNDYNFTPSTVFPVGPYPGGPNAAALSTLISSSGLSALTQYGADVSLTLPTPASNQGNAVTENPNYKGCIGGTTTA